MKGSDPICSSASKFGLSGISCSEKYSKVSPSGYRHLCYFHETQETRAIFDQISAFVWVRERAALN
jgi:hypothetical protein